MRRGSLAVRLVRCRRAGCPCKEGPEARHASYYGFTRPGNGRTHSRPIPQNVEMVRGQIEAGREFRDALELHWNECERSAVERIDEAPGARVRAIEVHPGSLAVVERHRGTRKVGVSFARGIVIADGAQVLAEVALPVGGLMSNARMEDVDLAERKANKAAHTLGTSVDHSFMTLAFLALPLIPELKLTR